MQELCGGLIEVSVRRERSHRLARHCGETSIRFAHYTVAEYLESNRDVGTATSNNLIHNAAPSGQALEFLFSHALRYNAHWHKGFAIMQRIYYSYSLLHAVEKFDKWFEAYCLLLSLGCDRKQMETTGQCEVLKKMASKICDTVQSQPWSLPIWLKETKRDSWWFEPHSGRFGVVRVQFTYLEAGARQSGQLCQLICAKRFPRRVVFFFAYLTGLKDLKVDQWDVNGAGYEIPWFSGTELRAKDAPMNSSVLREFIASMAKVSSEPSELLDILVTRVFGLRTVLIDSIIFLNDHKDDQEHVFRKVLERLLQLGLKIDDDQFYYKALQLAVGWTNVHAIRALLEAGTQVNPVGNPQGPTHLNRNLFSLVPSRGSFSQSNQRKSPLRSCTNTTQDSIHKSSHLDRLNEIRKILLQYIAEDFSSDEEIAGPRVQSSDDGSDQESETAQDGVSDRTESPPMRDFFELEVSDTQAAF